MNGLLGNNYRKVAGTEGARYEHSMQRTRVSSGARLLGFVSLAAMLILGNSSAFAQESKPAAQVTKPAAGNAESGKKLFAADGCYECHDREGQGGGGTGPRLAPNPLPFSAFIHQLRQPANQMPPYTEKVLSDAQAADIYAFLQSIPKAPAVASIPLLQGK